MYIGYSGSGTLQQTGGATTACSYNGSSLYLGYNRGGNGTYSLSGGTLSAYSQYVGYSGAGAFTQSGGTNNCAANFILGYNPGATGTYSLGGAGTLLTAGDEYVGSSGTGILSQSGGSNTPSSLYLGSNAGGSGSYNLSGGAALHHDRLHRQFGRGKPLPVGRNPHGLRHPVSRVQLGASGAYNLSGTGQLTAPTEYVGYVSAASASFQQSGGTNATADLSIGAGGQYQLAGGTLQVGGPLVNQGVFEGGNSPATLDATGLVDLTAGTWKNLGNLSVNMGANSLLIVPAGFNPATGFAGYSSLGMTHTAGTPLSVSAGTTISGAGSIGDPVACQGTITPGGGASPSINLNNGLVLSGAGTVALGSNGNLTVNDWTSAISGGSLSAASQYVGSGGTGSFAHSGGSNNLTTLYLGYNTADSGTYALSGSANLNVNRQYIGYYGTGTFTQSGGTNSGSIVEIGYQPGSNGTYNLTAGTLSQYMEWVGDGGQGSFIQSGGTNTISNGLLLGNNSSGSYKLSGGSLSSPSEQVGYGVSGSFVQSGGTNATGSLYVGFVYNAYATGGNGTYTQTGGTTTVANLYVGDGVATGGSGTFSLGGTGVLSAQSETIGDSNVPIALLQQTGGTNTTNNLTLGANGQYVLSGGTLTVNGNLVNNGTIDGAGGAATLAANSLVDLTSGTWKNYSDWSVNMGSSGLVIVPAGSNPASCFANFTTSGLGIHVAGTTLNVPAGKGFTGIGSINDPVACQGTVAVTSGGTINFTNGLTLSGSGSVGLGTGNLTVNDLASGISGGSLSAANQYVGSGGTGAFAHSAGTSTLSGGLYLGNNATDAGTYNLSGTGLLSAPTQYVGNSGAGTFNQAGGTNTASNNLYIGYNSTAAGTYNLSGGSLSTPTEYVGYSGERLRANRWSKHRYGQSVRRLQLRQSRDVQSVGRDHGDHHGLVFGLRPGGQRRLLAQRRRHALGPHRVHRLQRGRHGAHAADRRREHVEQCYDRSRRPVLAQRRHAPDRQRRDPHRQGRPRRRRRDSTTQQRNRHAHRPFPRDRQEHRFDVRKHGGQFAPGRAPRLRPEHRLRQL